MVKGLEEPPKNSSDKNCPQHPKNQVKFYCLDCKTKSCINCVDSHAGHQFKQI